MKHIVIMTASSGKNLALANDFSELQKELGFTSSLINLEDYDLPLYGSRIQAKGIPDSVLELRESLKSADSMVFLSPEYNGSTAPSLVNAIAWLSVSTRDWREVFNEKPCIIGTHSGGGGAHVLMAMRSQLSFIGMNVIGRQILSNYNKAADLDSIRACLKQII